MFKRFAQAAVLPLLFFGAVGQAAAASLDELQGAWTMEGTGCADTFKKTGGTIEFKDRGSSLNTGLIIKGSEILGPLATCTVQHIRQKKDYLSAQLSCADTIMFNTISVSFRILDATKFERFDSEFPDFSVPYNKCEL